jgi:polyisoprenoid-binding protein YceI
MQRILGFSALIILLIGTSAFVAQEVINYSVDTNESTIIWKGYKVAGGHEGTIDLNGGDLEYTDGLLTGGSFEIDMTTMKVTDLKGGSAEKLLGHLKSDDFFGVANHPTAKFVITSVSPQGTNRYKVTGDLTIKETTKPIKFITTTKETDGIITANAEIEVDRSEYDVKYGSGTFFDNLGDKAIYDNFDLNVTLVTEK